MSLLIANFKEPEVFYDSAKNWDLDFRLLSKNDFSVNISLLTTPLFQIGRTKISGKTEQFGLTPKGFRSFVVPANKGTEFIWLNRKVHSCQMLIFPKSRTLDAVSFNNFDVYVVSIEESLLFSIIENQGYTRAKELLNGDEQFLQFNNEFASEFYGLASDVLSYFSINNNTQGTLIKKIVFSIIKYLEYCNNGISATKKRKRDAAIIKAVKYIHNQSDDFPLISELCEIAQVSERTLEYAFLEKYRVTPVEYIKSHRLNMVKKEITKIRGEKINISTLAGKYGFWHMGQFAKDFKNHFGYLPSDIKT